MPTIETILTRMMNDSNFANAVFADTKSALAEYDLHPAELSKFKGLSRALFDAMATTPEHRISLGRGLDTSSPILYNILTNNE